MAQTKYFETLRREIFALSDEKHNWAKACLEWVFIEMTDSETERCACGHHVKFDFWINNVENDNTAHLGSVCIKKFMRANIELVADVEQAERDWGKNPCLFCKQLTKKENRLHARCVRKYEEQQRILKLQVAKQRLYAIIVGKINMNKLNAIERSFVEESVQGRIMSGTALTPKQREWLMRIIVKYPSEQRRAVQVVEHVCD